MKLGFEMLNEEIAAAKGKSLQADQQLTAMADTYFQFAFALFFEPAFARIFALSQVPEYTAASFSASTLYE